MSDTSSTLKTTALFDLHKELGAKLVPFAGYEMPVQYPLGVLKEHLHTRTSAGLFDVSHMGQIRLRGPGIALALESLVPVDVIDLPSGQQRYALFTNERGGISDDLMITKIDDEHFILVVNAACKHRDAAYLRASLPSAITLEELSDRALLALQGPKARTVLSRFAPEASEMLFMQAQAMTIAGFECFVSCSGYSGEDGYEISVSNVDAKALAETLLACEEVEAVGLGARDSLRLEAGLCLYGHDLDEHTTPIEASLLWSVSKVRRPGGARAGGYPGASFIEKQINTGAPRKRLILRTESRAPIREGADIVDASGVKVGRVCSGSFGPTINGPVLMAYVQAEATTEALFAVLRKKHIPVEVVVGRLLPSRYFRG